jgi:NAD(P)-dependent dehydrogenase (short-subunit alcohol dehydrogenase family)
MPTAIITGATGILGREIVAALGKDKQWTKIHALSRSQKEAYPPTVQHDHVDLTAAPQEIAKQLKAQNVTGEYLFFSAYLAKDTEEEASDVNGIPPLHFLGAQSDNTKQEQCYRTSSKLSQLTRSS